MQQLARISLNKDDSMNRSIVISLNIVLDVAVHNQQDTLMSLNKRKLSIQESHKKEPNLILKSAPS